MDALRYSQLKNYSLYPNQRLVLKLIFNLPLLSGRTDIIYQKDYASIIQRMGEIEYLERLEKEGRYFPATSVASIKATHIIAGRRSGKSRLASLVASYLVEETKETTMFINMSRSISNFRQKEVQEITGSIAPDNLIFETVHRNTWKTKPDSFTIIDDIFSSDREDFLISGSPCLGRKSSVFFSSNPQCSTYQKVIENAKMDNQAEVLYLPTWEMNPSIGRGDFSRIRSNYPVEFDQEYGSKF